MSVQTQISRLNGAKTTLSTWLTNNGYSVGSTDKLDDIAANISAINLQRFYAENSEPDDSLGEDGDLYLVTEA